MPVLGYGVYQVSNEECERCVLDAISVGYRSIDTAQAYGNEEAVGNAIRKCGVPRNELFITTKVWVQDAKSEETAYEAVKSSLAKLDMSYVDLILLHQPMGDYFAAYRGIEKAYKEGLVKAVGVANFYPAILANLCENVDVIPAVNQVELHPFFVQAKALENMKAYGVAPQAWGPLAEGRHGILPIPSLWRLGENTARVRRRSF